MSETVFFEGRQFRVTSRMLSTPRRSYRLHNLEAVRLKQPLLILSLAIGAGLLGTVVVFWRYLYAWEVVTMGLGSVVAVGITARLGTLKVKSLAIGDQDGVVVGDIGVLRQVKIAVETALHDRRAD
ncbi:MAG: hypothetical protein AAF317_08660 [Pseudomonadota bacterium]